MNLLWTLYFAFFRIGLFTIGGGFAMLPMLRRETVDHYHWVTEEEILDCYAIGQCTPGVIAVNTATYVGYRVGGNLGSVFATAGEVTPSLIIITLIAAVLENVMKLDIVMRAFSGIRVAVIALMVCAVINLFKKGVKKKSDLAIFFAVIFCSLLFGVSPVFIIPSAILLGIILTYRKGGNKV